jgi:ABC-type transport system involved in multi-copper enzyme maturation permease subunit
MSTPTIAARKADAGPRQGDGAGFGQLLHAEWTKFRTVRGWVIGMAVAALVTVLLGLLIAGGGSSTCQHSPGSPVLSGPACLPHVPLGPGGLAVTDQFYFVRQPLAGNVSITVRVTSLTGVHGNGSGQAAQPGQGLTKGVEPWSKAGVIIKESTRPGSAYAAMMVTGGHGVRLQYDYTHDTAGLPGAVSAASARWLRLTRSGDTITGYDSADGMHWTQVGTAHLAGLSATVQAGLFATSPGHTTVVSQSLGGDTSAGGPTLATAVFDHASLPGLSPSGGWTGDAVGGKAAGGAASSGHQGFHQAGGRFTVTGSGDIAPLVPPAVAGFPASTIGQGLVGTFAGLIAVVVVAVMFITAEYRRGLIRITLAASPRRGRVLAAKAAVAGAVTFAAGLAAAIVTVLLGNRVAHAKGVYVLPVTSLTELRVIAGTAALLAVAAVLALAIGTALRRSAGAVTAVIVVIVLPYLLGTADVLPAGAANWLLRVTPAAAFAIQQSVPQYPQVTAGYTPTAGYFPLAPWAGFAVLCGYAVLALALAAFLLRRRDA